MNSPLLLTHCLCARIHIRLLQGHSFYTVVVLSVKEKKMIHYFLQVDSVFLGKGVKFLEQDDAYLVFRGRILGGPLTYFGILPGMSVAVV